MKHNLLIFLGTLLLLLAFALCISNEAENDLAAHSSHQILLRLQTQILDRTEPTTDEPAEYLGILTIPALDLELPVRLEWSEELLKTAPCRFSGSLEDGNLVIMAHNYRSHFGPIRRLKPGDEVLLTDLSGVTLHFKVSSTAKIAPDDTEAVTESGYPLTLFTCTYGAQTRTAVFCIDSAETAPKQ